MYTEEEERLLAELKRIKEQFYGQEALLTLQDAADYETGLLIRMRQDKAPSLQEAITRYLQVKSSSLSSRSRAEYGTYLRKLLRQSGAEAKEKLSKISVERWKQILQKTYTTPAGRNKARRLLHGLYEHAKEQGWITHNHICDISLEKIEIKRKLCILSADQLQKLLRELLKPQHISLAATVGFMLWEGARVCELKKMRWEHVNRHSLSPSLQQWLNLLPTQYHGSLLPNNWTIQWRILRTDAGLTNWQNDTLRHTYAFYHLYYYNDPEKLANRFKRFGNGDIVKELKRLGKISRSEAENYWNGTWYAEFIHPAPNE